MFCLSSSPRLIQSETIENGETQEILTSEKLEPENVLVLLCDNDLNYWQRVTHMSKECVAVTIAFVPAFEQKRLLFFGLVTFVRLSAGLQEKLLVRFS